MAKYVLIIYPRHAGMRSELRDEQGHLPGFSKLLGTAVKLQKTTKSVMQRGIMGQFRGVRDTLYGPSHSLSPAHDLFWLRFEVLEAPGNSADNAPAGGGPFPPEGFPFSNM